MSDHKPALGCPAWVQQTQGWMTAAERRSLVGPLARTHLSNGVGRLRVDVSTSRGLGHMSSSGGGLQPTAILRRPPPGVEPSACGSRRRQVARAGRPLPRQ